MSLRAKPFRPSHRGVSRPTSDAKGTNRFFGEPQEGALRVTALEQFVRCYERRVFAFLSRALGYGLSVDDLAQEVFMRAYQALSEFEPTGRARPSTWLFTIAYHVLVDARRRQKSDYVMLSEEHESIDPNNPERQLWHRQLNAALARAVAELSPDQRDTFVLAEFHELSVTDIARVIGTLESTVKTRLFRARPLTTTAATNRFIKNLQNES